MYQEEDKIGDYVLVKFLGRGQYGEVWLAEKQLQVSTRSVRHALKFLFKNGDDEIDLKSAASEIDTWIEASGHPNVMSVIDMLVLDDRMIIVSEFAEGGSLKSWLDRNNRRAPSPEAALVMLKGVLRGIEHLHSKNVVHRDLKPDNILLQGDFPRITDFGISRIVSESTMSTKAIGSPAYMSPESFDGDKRAQADLWAAGVILYGMLAGAYPFSSESFYGLFEAIRNQPATPLSEELPLVVRSIVYRALDKDCSRRYQTATEMREAVEQAIFELKSISSQELKMPQQSPLPETRLGAGSFNPFQTPNSKETIQLPGAATSDPTVSSSFTDSMITAVSSATRRIEADRTDEKNIEQTANWSLPQTVAVNHHQVPEKSSPQFAGAFAAFGNEPEISQSKSSLRLFTGIAGDYLDLSS